MQQWTNGRWVSTVHRVTNPAGEDWASRRLSLGFFCHPNYDAPVAALLHEPVMAGVCMNRKITAIRRPAPLATTDASR